MLKTKLIQEELIYTQVEAKTQEELFCLIGNRLISLGYVKPSFIPAIINREIEYPTGLALEGFNVAIPHTDPVHVEKPFVAVVKNNQKIPFVHMGSDDMTIEIDCFFILGIKDPTGQIMLLQTLMERFNDQVFVETLKANDDVMKLYEFLQETI